MTGLAARYPLAIGPLLMLLHPALVVGLTSLVFAVADFEYFPHESLTPWFAALAFAAGLGVALYLALIRLRSGLPLACLWWLVLILPAVAFVGSLLALALALMGAYGDNSGAGGDGQLLRQILSQPEAWGSVLTTLGAAWSLPGVVAGLALGWVFSRRMVRKGRRETVVPVDERGWGPGPGRSEGDEK